MAARSPDIQQLRDSIVLPGLSPFSAPTDGPLVVFDTAHGQGRWAHTGFDARTLGCAFFGLALACDQLGCPCVPAPAGRLATLLPVTRLLVIPPPTGIYHPGSERWIADPATRFPARELNDIRRFVRGGGRLLAFAYRFGDSFTRTNLADLFPPLGCRLNQDAVLDLTRLRATHPLQAYFDTPPDLLPLPWSQVRVRTVRWRPCASFRLLPKAPVRALALSPGGRCIAFDRARRRIRFVSVPLAVAGLHGRGRFAVFGGPHLFESGLFGLLGTADNAAFLRNVLSWLLSDDPLEPDGSPPARAAADTAPDELELDGRGQGRRTVAYVERLLVRTGMLKALSRTRWMP